MKFSLWNFRDWYEQHGLDLSHLIMDNTASVSMLACSPSAARGRLGCALVQSGENQPDSAGFRTILRYGNDRILFPVASSSEVLNCGNAMIAHYTDWENMLFDHITSGCSIDVLLASAQKQFPFPLAFYPVNGSLQCKTEDWSLPSDSHLAQSIITAVSKNSDRAQPFFNTLHENRSYTFMADTLYVHHIAAGTLIAYESERKFQPGDIHIFRTICETLAIAIEFSSSRSETTHPLAAWFADAIQTESSSPTQAIFSDWHSEDYYQIEVIRPADILSKQLCTQLTNSDHCCITDEDKIVMLVHLPKFHSTSKSEEQRLSGQYASQIDSAGLSLPFQGLQNLRSFYEQAKWAQAQAHQDGVFCVSLTEFLPEYILQSCCSLSDTQTFIHPDILRLAEIDRTEQEHLLKTLYTYLIFGCSVSQTTDALFIHRNTLRTRLKRIRSELTVSWENEAERSLLLLSIILYSGKTA